MPKKLLPFLCLMLCLSACGKSHDTAKESDKKEAKTTLVTVTQLKNSPLEITESAVGSLESLTDPTIAAEVAARVVNIHVNVGQRVNQGQLIATLDATDFGLQRNEAQTEVLRIQAQLENQKKIVARNQALVEKKFISQTVVDNDTAQLNVLQEQLKGAQARVNSINHTSGKTRIFAPVTGTIQTKIVDKGDFVKVGDPLVQIISNQKLRAHLPFPEHVGAKLKAGLKIRLSTPTSDKVVETKIHELKPLIAEDSRTIDVIADITNETDWQPGATVNGTVILGEEQTALMVPEQSLVIRPAGEVVYVVRNNIAYQAVVKTGLRQNGLVEVQSGLNANDSIVVDGAGFLTDKAPVKIAPDATPKN
jgi:membrane fusion protein (multidrug efflux system)